MKVHLALGAVLFVTACSSTPKLTEYEGPKALDRADVIKGNKDCQDAGFVDFLTDKDGVKVKRPSPSGSNALVWTLTQTGCNYVITLKEARGA